MKDKPVVITVRRTARRKNLQDGPMYSVPIKKSTMEDVWIRKIDKQREKERERQERRQHRG